MAISLLARPPGIAGRQELQRRHFAAVLQEMVGKALGECWDGQQYAKIPVTVEQRASDTVDRQARVCRLRTHRAGWRTSWTWACP